MSSGYFWWIENCGLKPVVISHGYAPYQQTTICESGKPFFHIMTENSTVKLFLDAVARDIEDARCFISKNCLKTIDLFELKDSFQSGAYKCLLPVEMPSKNCRMDTVLLLNEKRILRFYMIREPDRFGQWKIVSLERE